MTSKCSGHRLSAIRKLRVPLYLCALTQLIPWPGVAQTLVRGWDVGTTTNIMNDQTTFQAVALAQTNDGHQDGKIKVTATCRAVSGHSTTYDAGLQQVQVPSDSRSINFQIVFAPDDGSGVGFLRNGRYATVNLRIDSDPPTQIYSVDRFSNEVNVEIGTNRGGTNGNGTLAADGPDHLGKLIRANRLLIELTTENGVQHILEINPQEPSFQRFVSGCGFNVSPAPLQRPGGGQPSAQATAPNPLASHLAFGDVHLGPPEKRAGRTYTGTMDGFFAALPGYIQKAAAGISAPPRSYDYEVKYIEQSTRLCASITAAQAASVTIGTFVNVSKLGAEYRPCGSAYGLQVPRQDGPVDPAHPPQLVAVIKPIKSWGDGNGISVVVAFTGKDYPGVRAGDAQSCATGLDCGIVTGLIDGRK